MVLVPDLPSTYMIPAITEPIIPEFLCQCGNTPCDELE
jgi:hypothetical protein